MRTKLGSCAFIVVSVFCSSCETATQKKAVFVPPPPAPEVKPPPVVVAQTVAQLPDPQPIPPGSVPPRPPIEYHPPVKEVEAEPEPAQDPKVTTQAPKTPRPVRRAPTEAPVTETAPPTAAAPTTPPVEEPAKLSTADAASISREQVNATLSEVQKILNELTKRKPSGTQATTIARIRSLVKQAEQSANRTDLHQGDILAHRALALARDLVEPK